MDSSALVAIIFDEPEADAFLALLMGAAASMSAATYFETGMVIDRKAEDDFAAEAFERLLTMTEIEVVPVTRRQAVLARLAYRKYGKGNHEARLDFGDCFAYALARETGEPLLFKGDDFAQTDVIRAA